jgi:2-isopropylmalate synthase
MDRSTRKTVILDSTLHAGGKVSGFNFTRDDKILITKALDKLGVDIIEAGFPGLSNSEFNDVCAIANQVQHADVAAWTDEIHENITKAGEALAMASSRRIHIFVPTRMIYNDLKLKLAQSSFIHNAVDAINHARDCADVIELEVENAIQMDPGFLSEFCQIASEAGVDVISIPDTFGYSQPVEFGSLIKFLHQSVPGLGNGASGLSVHCFNDLGLATANALAGLKAGAGQVETSLLGIGERAGITPLEEIVMTLKVRSDYYLRHVTGINSEYICEAIRLISRLTGVDSYPIKPIAGKNVYTLRPCLNHMGANGDIRASLVVNPVQTGFKSYRYAMSRSCGSKGIKIIVKELTGIELKDKEAEAIYLQYKSNDPKNSEMSASDILLLLYNKGFVKSDIWRLRGFKYAYNNANSHNKYLISFTIANQHGDEKFMKLNEDDLWITIIQASKSLFHLDMCIKEYSLHGSGDENRQSGRMDIAVEFKDSIFYSECDNEDGIIAFINCYIDIINQILARYPL